MKKMILAAALVAMLAGALGAQENESEKSLVPYVKATVGYQRGGSVIKTDFGGLLLESSYLFNVSGFEVVPAFGLLLPVELEAKFGTMKLAAEAQVGLTFGKSGYGAMNDGSSFSVNPGLMGIFNYYFPKDFAEALRKLNGHVGMGFSVPITTVKGTMTTTEATSTSPYYRTVEKDFSATGVAFKLNFLLGAQYDFTDHISAVIDWNMGLFGAWTSSIRAGAVWRF